MSRLAEDLLEAERELLQAEAASDAARRAEVEALARVTRPARPSEEAPRRRRLSLSTSTSGPNSSASRQRRRASAHAQRIPARRIAEQARDSALDRLEQALAQSYVSFAALASRRHEAADLLETSSRWLRQNVGEDVPGGLAAPASTTTLLDRVASASHAEIAAAVNGRETLVTCRIAVPIFRIVPTHQPTVEPKE
jgi:hypothetical protein